MIRGIKFACVPVRDQDRALQFYTEKLGFRVMTDQPFGVQRWIELGIPGAESQLVLFTPEGHEDRIGGFQAVTFWTDGRVCDGEGDEGEGSGICGGAEEGALGDEFDLQGRGWESVCVVEQVRWGAGDECGLRGQECPRHTS